MPTDSRSPAHSTELDAAPFTVEGHAGPQSRVVTHLWQWDPVHGEWSTVRIQVDWVPWVDSPARPAYWPSLTELTRPGPPFLVARRWCWSTGGSWAEGPPGQNWNAAAGTFPDKRASGNPSFTPAPTVGGCGGCGGIGGCAEEITISGCGTYRRQ